MYQLVLFPYRVQEWIDLQQQLVERNYQAALNRIRNLDKVGLSTGSICLGLPEILEKLMRRRPIMSNMRNCNRFGSCLWYRYFFLQIFYYFWFSQRASFTLFSWILFQGIFIFSRAPYFIHFRSVQEILIYWISKLIYTIGMANSPRQSSFGKR